VAKDKKKKVTATAHEDPVATQEDVGGEEN